MLYREAIEPRTLDLLDRLSGLGCLKEYTLVGGTALALQYGHRISVDLDFFAHVNALDEYTFSEAFKTIGTVQLLNQTKVMLGYLIDNIKVDVVKYPYPFIRTPIQEENLRLAQPEDIAAMKLAAISNRGRKKDFTDIYFLLKNYSLDEMLHFYNEKYKDGNSYIVLRSIGYFEDADGDEDPILLENVTWDQIRDSIKTKLREHLNEL